MYFHLRMLRAYVAENLYTFNFLEKEKTKK
jgi:hypothetical protein